MKFIKYYFILIIALYCPILSAAGKLSEMFEMGYLSAPYHTSLDIGLRYSGGPTSLRIEVSNNPNLTHDGNLPHIGHSFSEEALLYGYIADTFMNLLLEKIKFVVNQPAPAVPQAASQPSNVSMDLLENSKVSAPIHAGDKRTADEAGLLNDDAAVDDTLNQESENAADMVHPAVSNPEGEPSKKHAGPTDQTTPESTEEDDEEIHPPAEEIKLKPTLGLLLNIVSKTSSHFIIPFASGKDGDLNRGLMTLVFTSMPDTPPSNDWIQYPGKILSGQMITSIIQSTLLSKIKRTVDSQSVKNKGIYG